MTLKKNAAQKALAGLLSNAKNLLKQGYRVLTDSQQAIRLENYQAPPLKRSNRALLISVLIRLIFPPLLLWDLAKFACNWLFGSLIGKVVLPAQNLPFSEHFGRELDHFAQKHLSEKFHPKRIHVYTADGAILDTIELAPKQEAPLAEQQYVINFNGNAMCCEQSLENLIQDAKALHCHAIAFNYRGVCNSLGEASSKDHLIIDGIAQVERLLEKGVPAENITLKGFSLGGAISTLVAEHFHDRGLKVNVFNERSFSSLTNFLVGHIRKASWLQLNGHRENFSGKLIGFLFKPLLKLALAITNWEMDAASAWLRLPSTHKEHMLVRSAKEEREASQDDEIIDDAVITHYASLHAAIKSERSALKKRIEMEIETLEKEKPNAVINHRIKTLKEEKAAIKERKMTASGGRNHNAHCDDPEYLRGRHKGLNGQEFFYSFFWKAQKQHADAFKEKDLEQITLKMG